MRRISLALRRGPTGLGRLLGGRVPAPERALVGKLQRLLLVLDALLQQRASGGGGVRDASGCKEGQQVPVGRHQVYGLSGGGAAEGEAGVRPGQVRAGRLQQVALERRGQGVPLAGDRSQEAVDTVQLLERQVPVEPGVRQGAEGVAVLVEVGLAMGVPGSVAEASGHVTEARHKGPGTWEAEGQQRPKVMLAAD